MEVLQFAEHVFWIYEVSQKFARPEGGSGVVTLLVPLMSSLGY